MGQEQGYMNLNCSLCIPAATSDSLLDKEDQLPFPALDTDRDGDSDDARGVCVALSAADVGVKASQGEVHAWRILPAHMAISLRLERLTPSRPPRPCRMPQAAPTDSVCRLRLGILGWRKLIRPSHPHSLRPGHPVPTAYTVIIGWNGNHRTVGPPVEWPVTAPLSSGVSRPTAGLSADLLLEVPRTDRGDLVLTFKMVASPPQTRPRAVEGEDGVVKDAAASETLGRASIDWDGLSCLPVSTTGYMVETLDGGRASSTGQSLRESATVDLELSASNSMPRNNASDHGAVGRQSVESASGAQQASSRGYKQDNRGPTYGCHRTAGVALRVSLLLETSPASVPHVLSLSPVAVKGPSTDAGGASPSASCTRAAVKKTTQAGPPPASFSLGDFRNPSRKHRIPYLRFSWSWDDDRLALTERRNSLVPRAPWKLGSRRALCWTKPAVGNTTYGGVVSCRLPLKRSESDGSVSWPGAQALRNNGEDNGYTGRAHCTSDVLVRRRESTSRLMQDKLPCSPPVLFVEAYDMGPFAPLEHRAAMTVQRLWRQALRGLRSAREWWEYYATMDRHNAAVCVQANYRGWRGRRRARDVRGEAAERVAAASTIQRRWR